MFNRYDSVPSLRLSKSNACSNNPPSSVHRCVFHVLVNSLQPLFFWKMEGWMTWNEERLSRARAARALQPLGPLLRLRSALISSDYSSRRSFSFTYIRPHAVFLADKQWRVTHVWNKDTAGCAALEKIHSSSILFNL